MRHANYLRIGGQSARVQRTAAHRDAFTCVVCNTTSNIYYMGADTTQISSPYSYKHRCSPGFEPGSFTILPLTMLVERPAVVLVGSWIRLVLSHNNQHRYQILISSLYSYKHRCFTGIEPWPFIILPSTKSLDGPIVLIYHNNMIL